MLLFIFKHFTELCHLLLADLKLSLRLQQEKSHMKSKTTTSTQKDVKQTTHNE